MAGAFRLGCQRPHQKTAQPGSDQTFGQRQLRRGLDLESGAAAVFVKQSNAHNPTGDRQSDVVVVVVIATSAQ